MVNNQPQEDSRKKIYNNFMEPLINDSGLLDMNIPEENELIKSYDIEEFKTHFNNLLENFKTKQFYVDDIFRNLSFSSKLSKVIKMQIYRSIEHDMKLNTHSPAESQRLLNLYNEFKRDYVDNDDVGIINTDNSGINSTFYESVSIFGLYNRIVTIENLDTQGSEQKKLIKELSLLVMKYYFLTEMLLKMLLDTNYNNNNGDDKIINNFQNYSSETGLGRLHNYNEIVTNINSCTFNNTPSTRIKIQMDLLIKQIYFVMNELRRKLNNITDLTSDYTVDDTIIPSMNETIDKLDADKNKFIHFSRTIKNKQNYKNKNSYKERMQFIILLVLVCILVFANLYIFILSKDSSETIFLFNMSIIVLIIIMKFYYLLK
jgi:hypothetical protein